MYITIWFSNRSKKSIFYIFQKFSRASWVTFLIATFIITWSCTKLGTAVYVFHPSQIRRGKLQWAKGVFLPAKLLDDMLQPMSLKTFLANRSDSSTCSMIRSSILQEDCNLSEPLSFWPDLSVQPIITMDSYDCFIIFLIRIYHPIGLHSTRDW